MKEDLIALLKDDHDKIRFHMSELKRWSAQSPADEGRCIEQFRLLKAHATAHIKAEEFALYSLVEQPQSSLELELQHYAFEGYEEHDLIDFLMKEMATAEEISPQWRAQVIVLCNMLERHLNIEELEFFPKMEPLLTEKVSSDLGQAYVKEREMIFAKKMGARPALTLAPPIHF